MWKGLLKAGFLSRIHDTPTEKEKEPEYIRPIWSLPQQNVPNLDINVWAENSIDFFQAAFFDASRLNMKNS